MTALNWIKMTYNGNPSCLDDLGQFLRDVRRHIVMLRPFGLGRVEVESSASSKVPICILTRNACATRGSVRKKDGNTLTSGNMKEASLLSPMSYVKMRVNVSSDICGKVANPPLCNAASDVPCIFSAGQSCKVN